MYKNKLITQNELIEIIKEYIDNHEINNDLKNIIFDDNIESYGGYDYDNKIIYINYNKHLNKKKENYCINVNSELLNTTYHELSHIMQKKRFNDGSMLGKIYFNEYMELLCNKEKYNQRHASYCMEYNASFMANMYTNKYLYNGINLKIIQKNLVLARILLYRNDRYPTMITKPPIYDYDEINYLDRFLNGLPLKEEEKEIINKEKEKIYKLVKF